MKKTTKEKSLKINKDIDNLLARAEQAFKIRQYALNEHQRDALRDYGRSLVEDAVAKLEELNVKD